MKDYRNKVVWITGASSGIGEALAVEFGRQDAILVLSARREDELLRVKNRTPYPERVYILPLDLAETDAFEAKVQTVIDTFGRIDVLFHNGGVSHRSYAIDTPLDITRKVFEVDFFSYVALTKAVLPHFIRQKGGQIGVVGSLAGKTGLQKRSAYSAAKHALLGYFDTLRAELYNENIRVTVFCPGAVNTSISCHALLPDGSENNRRETLIEKGVSPERFARRALSALARNKREVYNHAVTDRIAVLLIRFFPSLLAVLLRKQKF
jgi:short-subunit dehydrogenase